MDILKYTTNLVTSLIRTIPDPDEYWNLSAYINLELFMVIQLWTICLIVTKQDWRKWCGPPRFCAVTKSGKQSFFSKKDRIWRVNIFAVSAPLSWTGEKWDWLICLDLAFRTHYHYWGGLGHYTSYIMSLFVPVQKGLIVFRMMSGVMHQLWILQTNGLLTAIRYVTHDNLQLINQVLKPSLKSTKSEVSDHKEKEKFETAITTRYPAVIAW